MKRLLVILLILPFASFAEEVADTVKYWKRSGVFSTNFSQVSLTNWAAGGQSSMAGVFLMNYSANYKKDSLSWDNYIDLGYGFLKNNDEALRKSTDKIEFNSKVGYNTGTNWNYAGLVSFKSQFAAGYNYKEGVRDGEPISKFLAPAYINVALGMDYKNDVISLFLSPATGKFTVVNDDALSAAGEFGVDPGKKFRAEMGASARLAFKKEVFKNVTAQSKIDLFSNYFHNPQNIDVDWTFMLNLKVNEWLSANLLTQLIYDDDVKIENKDTGYSAPMVQFMEMFGVGLSFKF
jgi:hypothetical protein